MKEVLRNKNIAFIGGGMACRAILKIILGETFLGQRPNIVGVADINDQAPGLKYAIMNGIFTTHDYRKLYNIRDLNLIIELTGNDEVRDNINKTKPKNIKLMDHIEALHLWDFVQIEEKKIEVLDEIRKGIADKKGYCALFEHFASDLARILLEERTKDLQEIQEKQERRNRELSSLCAIYTALGSSLKVEDRLGAVADEIIRNLNVDSVGIYISDKENGKLQSAYSTGYADKFWTQERKLGDGILGKVVAEGNSVIFEDITSSDSPYLDLVLKEGLQSAAYIPLISENKSFGVIRISSHTFRRFSPEDKNILEMIGNRLAVAIENSRLHQKTEEFSQVLEQKVVEKTKELEEAYQNLSKSEDRYRSMFNSDPNPIFIVYQKTLKIMDVNSRAVQCYKYLKKDLLKMSFTDLEYDQTDDMVYELTNLPVKQSHFYPKRRHKRKDGNPFFVNIHVISVKHLGQYYLIAATTDITESVEKETQLIQASKMSTLGTMASGMAHELSQPLSIIQASSDFFLKMIRRGETIKNEELQILSEEMVSQVDRAAKIIKHLRDFSRQSDVVMTMLNINEPIKDVFKILGQQLKVHQIEVQLDLTEDIPPIMADYNRIEQVFINLITNATDAMDEKGEELGNQEWERLLKVNSFPENGSIIVAISDTGKGIPKDIVEKIFEPFFTTKKVGKGTGLGMSISYGIVKDYGGTIDVKSEVGKGTTFELKFPICQ